MFHLRIRVLPGLSAGKVISHTEPFFHSGVFSHTGFPNVQKSLTKSASPGDIYRRFYTRSDTKSIYIHIASFYKTFEFASNLEFESLFSPNIDKPV